MEELAYIRNKKVWRRISRREAERRGIKIVKVRRIDINKGDSVTPIYRSRLVAKGFNNGKELGLFAAMPPLEAVKMLVSEAAAMDGGEEKTMIVNDVARVFFEAPMRRLLCVELPDEEKSENDDEDEVALLEMGLYGTRDAASNSQTEVKKFMTENGCRAGRYNAYVLSPKTAVEDHGARR